MYHITANFDPNSTRSAPVLSVTYELTLFADFLEVAAVVPVGAGVSTSGLCGASDRSDLVLPGGETAVDSFTFGDSWRVETGDRHVRTYRAHQRTRALAHQLDLVDL